MIGTSTVQNNIYLDNNHSQKKSNNETVTQLKNSISSVYSQSGELDEVITLKGGNLKRMADENDELLRREQGNNEFRPVSPSCFKNGKNFFLMLAAVTLGGTLGAAGNAYFRAKDYQKNDKNHAGTALDRNDNNNRFPQPESAALINPHNPNMQVGEKGNRGNWASPIPDRLNDEIINKIMQSSTGSDASFQLKVREDYIREMIEARDKITQFCQPNSSSDSNNLVFGLSKDEWKLICNTLEEPHQTVIRQRDEIFISASGDVAKYLENCYSRALKYVDTPLRDVLFPLPEEKSRMMKSMLSDILQIDLSKYESVIPLAEMRAKVESITARYTQLNDTEGVLLTTNELAYFANLFKTIHLQSSIPPLPEEFYINEDPIILSYKNYINLENSCNNVIKASHFVMEDTTYESIHFNKNDLQSIMDTLLGVVNREARTLGREADKMAVSHSVRLKKIAEFPSSYFKDNNGKVDSRGIIHALLKGNGTESGGVEVDISRGASHGEDDFSIGIMRPQLNERGVNSRRYDPIRELANINRNQRDRGGVENSVSRGMGNGEDGLSIGIMRPQLNERGVNYRRYDPIRELANINRNQRDRGGVKNSVSRGASHGEDGLSIGIMRPQLNERGVNSRRYDPIRELANINRNQQDSRGVENSVLRGTGNGEKYISYNGYGSLRVLSNISKGRISEILERAIARGVGIPPYQEVKLSREEARELGSLLGDKESTCIMSTFVNTCPISN